MGAGQSLSYMVGRGQAGPPRGRKVWGERSRRWGRSLLRWGSLGPAGGGRGQETGESGFPAGAPKGAQRLEPRA